MGQVRLADLPTTENITPESFVIIERPGIGDGSFKSTVRDLQKAITVTAKVERVDNVTTIYIDDINGHTEESIVHPTAQIRDNGDGTCTIVIQDTEGTTQETIFKDPRIIDPQPTEGSNNLVTSGTIFSINSEFQNKLDELGYTVSDELDKMERNMTDFIGTVSTELAIFEGQTLGRIELLESLAQLIYYTGVTLEDGQALLTEQGFELDGGVVGTVADMRNEGGTPVKPFSVSGITFENLGDAILYAIDHSGIIRLVGDASNPGFSVPEGKAFILDLNNYTLDIVGPGAGSSGTKTNGLQLLKNSNVTIRNGSLNFTESNLKIGIQNYSNLTLDNVRVFGGPTIQYVVSNNFGNITFKNATKITATGMNVAFDCWYGMHSEYDDGVHITIEDESVVIDGTVEFGKASRAPSAKFAANASITCPKGMDLQITQLSPPCGWSYSETTKTFRYVGVAGK